ncbi:MAG: hypothetical protein H6741_20865 [Alphaproteobacteria bacterium]|nr:hypothetical protein [Alphaproteobacteria bacterium]
MPQNASASSQNDPLAEFKAAQGARIALDALRTAIREATEALQRGDDAGRQATMSAWVDDSKLQIATVSGAPELLGAYWTGVDWDDERSVNKALWKSKELLGYLKRPLDGIDVR